MRCSPYAPPRRSMRWRAWRRCSEFLLVPDAAVLAAANKRIANLLRKSALAGGAPDPRLFAGAAEASRTALHRHHASRSDAALAGKRRYAEGARSCLTLRTPMDAFFERSWSWIRIPRLRNNRLALLGDVLRAFGAVADLSRLPG